MPHRDNELRVFSDSETKRAVFHPYTFSHHAAVKNPAEYEYVRVNAIGGGSVGYRRSLVRTQLPGYWSIEMEGSFSEFKSDEDGDFSLFDPPREIWFSSFSLSSENPLDRFEEMRRELKAENRELLEEAVSYFGTEK